jgi:hypothetical protein
MRIVQAKQVKQRCVTPEILRTELVLLNGAAQSLQLRECTHVTQLHCCCPILSHAG